MDEELRGMLVERIEHICRDLAKKDVDRLHTLVLIYGPFAIAGFLAMLAVMAKLLRQ